MTGQFGLDESGLHPLSEVHGDVADGLGQLTRTGTPHPDDIPPSFGHIASSMHRALGGVMESRGGTFQATQRSSDTIAGQLRQAHNTYMGTDETGARDITTASNFRTSAENGGSQSAAGGNHQGSNDIQGLWSTSGDPTGAAAGSSGTSTGGSSGTPAGAAATDGQSTGPTPHGATGAAASAAPTSAHDAAGGVGNAAAAGQSLSQVLGQTGQHAGSLGQAAGQALDGTSQNLGQLPQQIMQAAAQLGGMSGGEHGALGASAESVQALAHRSEPPDDHGDRRGAPPHDDPPPDEPEDPPPPDDQQPDDPQLQPPAPPPLSASPAPTWAPRQPNGRPDTRKV